MSKEDGIYYEVWIQEYNTFSRSDWKIHSRWWDRDAAEWVSNHEGLHWGTNSRVEQQKILPEISEATLEEVQRKVGLSPYAYIDPKDFM